jgi:hypothetical protein
MGDYIAVRKQGREFATRLGLVTINEMTAALVHAVEDPPDELQILNVPEIRAAVG